MEAIAKGKFLRGSPQKARLVIDMIRGKNVAQALAILKFTNKRATENIEKCLRSAIANATFKAEQDNIAIDPDDLWVKTCFVDMGPTKNRRRVRPAPQGRAYREQRYYCHVTIHVTSDQPENSKLVGKSKKAGSGSKVSRSSDNKVINASPVVLDTFETTKDTLPSEPFDAAPLTPVEPETASSSTAIENGEDVETSVSANAANVKTPAKNETESTSEEKKTD